MAITGQRYVSSEVAHFVGKGMDEEEQYQTLLKILNDGWITHPPHNPKIQNGNLILNTSDPFSSNEMYSPQIVCFCDIPIADLGIHIAKYSPFGLSFSKNFIAHRGGCPVFYLPKQANVYITDRALLNDIEEVFRRIEEGGPNALNKTIHKDKHFDMMVEEFRDLMQVFHSTVPMESMRIRELEHFINFQIFSYIKFYDHSYADDHDDNYYLEREWRVIGNIKFELNDIKTIFMPKSYSQRFKTDYPSYDSQLIFI